MSEVRLSDVATRARVSSATASRVLDEKPGRSRSNRERVLRAAADLGYALRAPRRSGHRLIGVIVPELHNPVFPAFAQELSTAFAARGRTVVIGTQADDGLSEEELISAFVDRGVEGLVVLSGKHEDSSSDPAPHHGLRREGIPLVLINGHLRGAHATYLSHDDAASMETAIRRLVALGHTRIGLASGRSRYTPARRKIDGLLAAMSAFVGKSGDGSIAYSLYSVEGGAVRTSGLRVSEQVSVVGHDDSPNMARAAIRAVITGAQQEHGTGAELLFEPELIVRASTGPAPERSTTTRRKA